MLKRFLNKLIHSLGRKDYKIDSDISFYNIAIIVFEKFVQILRGSLIKFSFKSSKGFVFIGKNVRLKHKNLISTGKTTFIGDYVEINALSRNGVQIGDNVSIHRSTIIDCTGGIRSIGEGIQIGNSVGFSPNCYIQVRGSVKIGDNVIFGPNVKIFSENHNFHDINTPITSQGETRKGVNIESDVWVGSSAVILDGVTIGKNSIIAAASLVNKDVPPNSIVAGIPAKIIKNR